MNITYGVASLESSRRLKELGVVQESYFVHETTNTTLEGEKYKRTIPSYFARFSGAYFYFSAFSVAELGVALPQLITSPSIMTLSISKLDTRWKVSYIRSECGQYKDDLNIRCETEADARAKMLIHLLETKTITLESVNERLRKG